MGDVTPDRRKEDALLWEAIHELREQQGRFQAQLTAITSCTQENTKHIREMQDDMATKLDRILEKQGNLQSFSKVLDDWDGTGRTFRRIGKVIFAISGFVGAFSALIVAVSQFLKTKVGG